MWKIFEDDFYRATGMKFKFSFGCIKQILFMHGLKYVLILRILQNNKGFFAKSLMQKDFFSDESTG